MAGGGGLVDFPWVMGRIGRFWWLGGSESFVRGFGNLRKGLTVGMGAEEFWAVRKVMYSSY